MLGIAGVACLILLFMRIIDQHTRAGKDIDRMCKRTVYTLRASCAVVAPPSYPVPCGLTTKAKNSKTATAHMLNAGMHRVDQRYRLMTSGGDDDNSVVVACERKSGELVRVN